MEYRGGTIAGKSSMGRVGFLEGFITNKESSKKVPD